MGSFSTMRLIVTVGWSIYPIGYFFGYLQGGVQDSTLNLVYNLADFVNKIAFCLAIWHSAKNSTLETSGNIMSDLQADLNEKLRQSDLLLKRAAANPTADNLKAAQNSL